MKLLSRSKLLLIGGALSLIFGATAAIAHHSTSGFDTDKVVKIEGEVTLFRWTNPHASIKIDGKVEGEEQTIWTIELTAPNVLINQGWKRSSLQKGQHVVVYANPLQNDEFRLRDGSKGALYVGVELADGSTLGSVDGTGRGSSD